MANGWKIETVGAGLVRGQVPGSWPTRGQAMDYIESPGFRSKIRNQGTTVVYLVSPEGEREKVDSKYYN